MNFFQELKWRGLVHSATDGAEEHVARGSVSGYIGFDPTASSLHVGSLLPIMGLVHFQQSGHSPIAIAGGGTGLVGDPSGKSEERKLLSEEEVRENLNGIRAQLARFLDFESRANPARLVNNADWLNGLTLMAFLRDTGKHFSVNEMLAKDSVRSRIEQQQGMSFTEFSYSLLQSYDFLELHRRYGCTLQMGGSDQWGNIVAGADLIRRVTGHAAHGIVFPLLATATGAKFGKTESGTVWLDPARTSPYRLYQFWLNTDDRDVVRYLKFFTLLPQERIAELEASLASSPGRREAHDALARDVTLRVHGEEELGRALRASAVFFGGELEGVTEAELLDIFRDVPSSSLPRQEAEGGVALVELLVRAGAAASKGEARRAIQGGGVYLNNRNVADADRGVTAADAVHGSFIVLRKGKKSYFLVRLV